MARAHPTTILAVLIIAAVVYVLVFYLPKPSGDTQETKRQDDAQKPKSSHALGLLHQHPKSGLTNLSTSPVINVMLCSDANTIAGLIAAVNSIRLNTKSHVRYYLVVDQASEDHLRKWIDGTELSSIDYIIKAFNDSWVKGKIPTSSRKDLTSPLNFARYYFLRLFPEMTGRLVFIDSDSVIQGDIEELSKVSMRPADAVAFSDDCTTVSNRIGLHQHNYASYINFENKNIKKLGFNPMKCSFNTGVFVANISLWKKRRLTAKLDYWLMLNQKENIFGTQKGGGSSGPPMMIVFYEKYSQLPPEWNVRHLGVSSGTRYSEEFVRAAKLLHWNGRYKPWGRMSQHTMIWEKFFVHDPSGKFKIARKYGNI